MFLRYQNDFWRIMWHWSNDAENAALFYNNYTFPLTYINIENGYFILSNYFTVLLYFSSNKWSHGNF